MYTRPHHGVFRRSLLAFCGRPIRELIVTGRADPECVYFFQFAWRSRPQGALSRPRPVGSEDVATKLARLPIEPSPFRVTSQAVLAWADSNPRYRRLRTTKMPLSRRIRDSNPCLDRDQDPSERGANEQPETLDNALQGEIRRTLDRIKERTR